MGNKVKESPINIFLDFIRYAIKKLFKIFMIFTGAYIIGIIILFGLFILILYLWFEGIIDFHPF